MGFAGVHLIVLLLIFLGAVAAIGALVYFLIRRSVAAGVRDGRGAAPKHEQQ